jgi:heme exporter protein D
MNEFFAMGGYGAYVWPSYIIAALVVGGMAIQTIREWRRARDRLRALEADAKPAQNRS